MRAHLKWAARAAAVVLCGAGLICAAGIPVAGPVVDAPTNTSPRLLPSLVSGDVYRDEAARKQLSNDLLSFIHQALAAQPGSTE
jgi:hypothetical protein